MREAPIGPDYRAVAFFDRPARDVVYALAETIFIVDTPRKHMPQGAQRPKILIVTTPEGVKSYRITLAEPYSEDDASPVWSGKRLQQIRNMQPGEIVAYRGRRASLSFIKTRGGDNIQIHELEDVETGRRTRNSTEVTGILGLGHAEVGRLTFIDAERLRFDRVIGV